MTSPQMARLDEHLQRLRLNTVRERVEALLQEAVGEGAVVCPLSRPDC